MIDAFLLGIMAVASPGPAPAADPDRIVCETRREIGSRLRRQRVCRTRAEWAAHRAQARQVVDHVQANRFTLCHEVATASGREIPTGC